MTTQPRTRFLGLVALSLASCTPDRRGPGPDPDRIIQVSVINALMVGRYDGVMPIPELLRHGDFGVGTLDYLDGEMVVQIATLQGTDIGGFMGLPPSGKAFRVPAVFTYQLSSGKIVREQRIYDFTGVLVQIGTLKAKPA